MNTSKIFFLALIVCASALTACNMGGKTKPGVEFAPQMYHTIAYDPYSTVVDTANEYYNMNIFNANSDGKRGVVVSNMRRPVTGTITRKAYSGMMKGELASQIYIDPYAPDSLELAGRELKNPILKSDDVMKEGEVLYLRYCSSCHGAEGNGQGKVADKYKGVPAYNTGLVAKVSGGHIFHVITHGKGRMWPHGPLVNPEERWKIVHYVQKLQKQK
jgi:mono/diheme cytochrome c family protein